MPVRENLGLGSFVTESEFFSQKKKGEKKTARKAGVHITERGMAVCVWCAGLVVVARKQLLQENSCVAGGGATITCAGVGCACLLCGLGCRCKEIT